MTTPIVSVVMSVLNGERFLREAVDSILAQSFGDFEFIVINDGSTDSSGRILDVYRSRDCRMQVQHQENRGLVDSLNRGCQLARGKYIARMDGDDVALRDRLKWQVEFMERHPNVGVVGGAVEVINVNGKPLAIERFPIGDREIKSALLRGECPLVHPTALMRRDVVVSVEGYRKVVVDAEDYDLWLRIADHYQLANLEAAVLKYRRHPRQVSVHRCGQQALSNLAARTAALSRRNGKPDPLDSVAEITPAVLAQLGVSEATQQSTLGRSYVTCIRSMYDAGEYSVAFNVIDIFHHSDWKRFSRPVIADFRLLAARLYWRQRWFAKSILSASHAVLIRPIMLGRPLKPLLRWLRLAHS